MTRQIMAAALGLAALSIPCGGAAAMGQSKDEASPVLVNTCLITDHVNELVAFYESVLNRKARKAAENYAEFRTDRGVLAIFSAASQESYIPGSAQAGNNRGVILEFQVSDVDAEYRRLQPIVKTWVKPPTTQPWGTRSIYFRDPDGNLVDFFKPATKE
jgi:uncharacterized glyoxalase superfamily protein PhnB